MTADAATSRHAEVLLVADVGRTTCRLARFDNGVRTRDGSSPSGRGLVDADGADALTDIIVRAVQPLLDDGARPAAIGVGATGAAQDPAAANELGRALQHRFPDTEVVVTSDVVGAHAGALAGDPGVLTIAGTGAVALAVSPSGESRIVDGAGWLLGDAGGGLHVGRAGLVAAVRWYDGRPDGSAMLADAAEERFGSLDRLAAQVHGHDEPARLLAGFTPDVATAARAGDDIARSIFAAATDELATTTLAACASIGETEPLLVSFTGGLFELEDLVASPVTAKVACARPRADIRIPAGDAIDGVYRLVTERSGRHQRLVQRLPAIQRATRSVADRQRQTVPAHPRSEER